MTRSHKLGWLVLAGAILFLVCKLPSVRGQVGFGGIAMPLDLVSNPTSSAVCTNFTYDDMQSYSTGYLYGLNGGTGCFNGPYVAFVTFFAPVIFSYDDMVNYSTNDVLNTVGWGTNYIIAGVNTNSIDLVLTNWIDLYVTELF